MKGIDGILKDVKSGVYDKWFQDVYIDEKLTTYEKERYEAALLQFRKLFSEEEVELYSAPGRSEVCGNHTDHQHGHVLAASVNLDAVAVAAFSHDRTIRLVSEDFPMVVIDLNELEKKEEELGTTAALIRGVAAGMEAGGWQIGGFSAYVTSDVPMGAGMSSSAAFESLVGTILSGMYNEGRVPSKEIAKIGQFAENVYFGKPCGLMDQMACSVGGLIYMDFKDPANPVIEQAACDFEENAYSLCIVETKGSHADLTDDYAAIPVEMMQVAKWFGREFLSQVDEKAFYENIPRLRNQVSDRAVLRAMHFFGEQKRVREGINALKSHDFKRFLEVIKKSGDSSAKMLQNIYSPKDVHTQNVTVALAASEYILQEAGVCRIHGGGFAGTIQAFVKNEAAETYKSYMESIFGGGACHVLKVRPYGGIKII